MKKLFLRFNLIGVVCIGVGLAFILFNIPVYMWLILIGICLILTGIFLCR